LFPAIQVFLAIVRSGKVNPSASLEQSIIPRTIGGVMSILPLVAQTIIEEAMHALIDQGLLCVQLKLLFWDTLK
jgi:hypothetical protein